jgi:hypothetical protein
MIPHEARDGLMRAWLAILQERHPNVSWIPVTETPPEPAPSTSRAETTDQPTAPMAA